MSEARRGEIGLRGRAGSYANSELFQMECGCYVAALELVEILTYRKAHALRRCIAMATGAVFIFRSYR